ncbi:MAG: hypothetical protein JRH15_18840 [Deltaproteobacteria bacterium]|nr:hypothetical protein [Deltaproteobacteria bacterium]
MSTILERTLISKDNILGVYFPSLGKAFCRRCLSSFAEMAANADANEPITYENVKDRPDTFCGACGKPIKGLP